MTSAPVTVVIPAYNAAKTIARALDSIQRQTAVPAEVLVVDDGSPDGEALNAALEPYTGLATLLRKVNGGAASARNHGLDHATQPWIAFLDADDYWESEKIARQLEVVDNTPDVQIVGCRWYEEHPGQLRSPSPHGTARYAGRTLRLRGADAFDLALVVWTGSLLVRREFLGRERFLSGLEPAEDRDLWVRLLSQGTAYVLPDLLATYVQEPGGISRSNIDRDCGNMLEVVRRHASLLGRAGARRQRATVERRWAGGYLARARFEKALPHAIRRWRLQPFSLEAWWIVLKCLLRITPGSRQSS